MFNFRNRFVNCFYRLLRRENDPARSMFFASTSSEVESANIYSDYNRPVSKHDRSVSMSRLDAWKFGYRQRVLRRLAAHLAALRVSSTLRQQCLTEIKALSCPCNTDHDGIAYTSPVEPACEEVVFTVVGRNEIGLSCLRLFLDISVITETEFGHMHDLNYTSNANGEGNLVSVVRTPRWVYHVLEHVVLEQRIKAESGDTMPVEVEVGWPVPAPTAEVLACALALWDPSLDSFYQQIGPTIAAAQLLV